MIFNLDGEVANIIFFKLKNAKLNLKKVEILRGL
jgi:hypothetical protein